MVKKERPRRVFRRGKKPLGKTSGKIRENKNEEVVKEIEVQNPHAKFPNITQIIPDIKEKLHVEFPNINQFISELSPQFRLPHVSGIKYAWFGAIFVGVILCLWQLWVFAGVAPRFFRLAFERNILETQLHMWEGISNRYPTYRDAHVEAALAAYRLGKKDILDSELKKTLAIDPNFVLPAELQSK